MTAHARSLPASSTPSQAILERVAQNLSRAVLGKDDKTRLAVTSLVARGHLLLEDAPGVGKTTLAEALARSFGLSFARIQFTSDLMPSDILGAQIFKQQTGTFEFRAGPLFQQLVLADELNRAPPRTQSALLEAMAQGQVSMDGVTHTLPEPFLVVATQNPEDLAGTFPLPDSQLDRFLFRLSIGHPSADVEVSLLQDRGIQEPVKTLPAVSSPTELLALQREAAAVTLETSVAEYVVRIANATREHPEIERGISTRAALSLVAACRAYALWEGRSFVTPGDVRSVVVPALAHRLLLRAAVPGQFSRAESGHLLEEIVRKLPLPR